MYDMGRLAQSMFSRASVGEQLPFEQKIWHHFLLFDGQELANDRFADGLLHVPVVLQMEPPLKTHNWPFSAHEELQLYIGYLCWLWLAAAAGTLSVSSEWAGPGGQWKTSPTPQIQERIMNLLCLLKQYTRASI